MRRASGCAICIMLAAPLLLVPLLDAPFPWVGVTWSAICFALLRSTSGHRARLLWWNLGAVFLILAIAEVAAPMVTRTWNREVTNSPEGTLYVPDPVLGFRPQPSSQTRSVQTLFGKIGYSAVYTIDDDGLRIGPPEAPNDSSPCVLFFGCSFTFGDGVNDDETMPYRVAVRAPGRVRVRNFAYSGYGPHQMLAAIESGIVEKAARCVPRYAVYGLLVQHIERVTGRFPFDQYGPRYVVGLDGGAVRSGNFHALPPVMIWRLCRKLALCRSALLVYRRNESPGARRAPAYSSEDVALLLAVLRSSRDRLMEKFPGIEFDTLVWPAFDQNEETVLAELAHAGLRPHSLAPVFERVTQQRGTALLPDNLHPTAATHDAVADYVVREVLQLEPATP